MSLVLWH